jgi:hypothetical protein
MNNLYKINDDNNNNENKQSSYTSDIKNAIFDYIKSYSCDDDDGECEFYE